MAKQAATLSKATHSAHPWGSSQSHARLPQSYSSEVALLGWQQTLGNMAVLDMVKSSCIQRKLHVGPAGDVFEPEADRVVPPVVAMSQAGVGDSTGSLRLAPRGLIQRRCARCEEEQTLRRAPKSGADSIMEAAAESAATAPTAETAP